MQQTPRRRPQRMRRRWQLRPQLQQLQLLSRQLGQPQEPRLLQLLLLNLHQLLLLPQLLLLHLLLHQFLHLFQWQLQHLHLPLCQ